MVPLLALSVQDQIEKLGAYAGFAAVIGLAVLALLYFAQAREVKRLREWAGRAPERARELEERVAQQAQVARVPAAQSQRRVVAQPVARPAQPQQATAAGAPARVAPPATVAAAGAAAGAATAAAAGTSTVPEEGETAAAGGNGQADAGATQLHQTIAPGDEPAVTDDEAGDGDGDAGAGERADGAPAAAAAPLRRAAAASAAPATPAAAAAASPPAPAASGPSAPAEAGVPPRPPQRPTYTRTPPPAREPEKPSRRRTWLLALAGVVVLAVGVGAAIALTGGDDTPPPPNKPAASAGSKAGNSSSSSSSSGAIKRGDVTVAVLNGTITTGLAADTSDRIVAAGFGKGAIDTNLDQTLTKTTVYYADGFKKAAEQVAGILEVKQVEPLPAQTAAIVNGQKDVVVVVGGDRTQ
jgi:hypothetical protein